MITLISDISGESMENALRACCKGIKIGKILIHGEGINGRQVCGIDCLISLLSLSSENFSFSYNIHLIWLTISLQLIYQKLPTDISSRHVLLLDPILASGNSAVKAISLLLSKGVPESNILFLNLIAVSY